MTPILTSFSYNFNTKIFNFLSKSSIPLKCYAFATGFIKRVRIITASDLICTLITSALAGKPTSLLEMTSILRSINPNAIITPQSLQERVISDACIAFLKMTLEDIFQQKILNVPQFQEEVLKPFKRVLIEDSSKWELNQYLEKKFKGFGGNGSKSYIKVNVIHDLISGKFIHFSEHSGTKSDQTIGQENLRLFKAGDLVLRDLGYLKIKNLKIIQEIGAFYLSRITGTTAIRLKKNGQPIRFEEFFNKNSIDGKLDIYVYVGTEQHYTRLVAFRAPQEVAEERRRRLNKSSKLQGHITAAETKSRLDFSIYITNVSIDIWPFEVIATIYRLRWQIELFFKSFKSQLNIHYMIGKNENRILMLLYSKWLAIIICTNFYELGMYCLKKFTDKEVSFYKMINWFITNQNFKDVILKKMTIKWLNGFINDLCSSWCKDKRNKEKSTRQMVENKIPSYLEGHFDKALTP